MLLVNEMKIIIDKERDEFKLRSYLCLDLEMSVKIIELSAKISNLLVE